MFSLTYADNGETVVLTTGASDATLQHVLEHMLDRSALGGEFYIYDDETNDLAGVLRAKDLRKDFRHFDKMCHEYRIRNCAFNPTYYSSCANEEA